MGPLELGRRPDMTDFQRHILTCLADIAVALVDCDDPVVISALIARRDQLLQWLSED